MRCSPLVRPLALLSILGRWLARRATSPVRSARVVVAAVTLASAVVWAAACDDQPSPNAPGEIRAQATAGTSSLASLSLTMPGEAKFAELSARVPSFGGYYFSGETAVTYLTDLRDSAALSAAIAAMPGHLSTAGIANGSPPKVAYRTSRYSFKQLSSWRAQIIDAVASVSGEMGIDLDERQNQIIVDVEDDARRMEAVKDIAALGLPGDAVSVLVSGPSTPDVTIRHRVRPVEGGLTINAYWPPPDTSAACTYGFNVVKSGEQDFVTASHCTLAMWALDAMPIYQHWYTDTTAVVGYEILDPAPFLCWRGVFDAYHCRYSDATLIRYTGPQDSVSQGYIVRTTYPASGWGNLGSRTIDNTHPHFFITAEQSYTPQGVVVQQMGDSTGWTQGTVTKTSAIYWGFNSQEGYVKYALLDQEQADYNSGGGDSGGPVFVITNLSSGAVTLVGMHVGHNSPQHFSWFSPIGGIVTDLGGPISFTLPPPPPTELSVAISGPTQIRPGAVCTWQANVSGGAPPYRYNWYNDGIGVGTQQWYTGGKNPGNQTDHFTLRVDVTDSGTGVGSATLVVYENPSAPICMQ